jgi:O-antigen/teichoic acid export membrane protein
LILKLFSKNIIVFGINVIASLAFFKALIYFTDASILANYFYTKAAALIAFFTFRVNFADIAFILKTNLKSTQSDIIGCLISAYGAISIILIILMFVFITLNHDFLLPLFIAFSFYIINDAIEAFVSISRLYYNYKIILVLRGLHLFKVALFLLIPINHLNLVNIVAFELLFGSILFLIIVMLHITSLNKKIINEFKYIKNHKNSIYSPWFQSLGKIAYDALPQVILGNIASDSVFIEYNIVRKMITIFNNAVQPLLQVFVAESTKFKNNYLTYVKKYLIVIVPFSFCFIFIVVLNYKIIVSIFAKEIYAVASLQILLSYSFILFSIFLILMPIKQYLMLHGKLKLLSIGFFSSSIILAISSYLLIPITGSIGAVFMQGIGLSLPLLIAISIYTFTPEKK